MSTAVQLTCLRCQTLNAPSKRACWVCNAPLAATGPPRPIASTPAEPSAMAAAGSMLMLLLKIGAICVAAVIALIVLLFITCVGLVVLSK